MYCFPLGVGPLSFPTQAWSTTCSIWAHVSLYAWSDSVHGAFCADSDVADCCLAARDLPFVFLAFLFVSIFRYSLNVPIRLSSLLSLSWNSRGVMYLFFRNGLIVTESATLLVCSWWRPPSSSWGHLSGRSLCSHSHRNRCCSF